MSGEPGKLRVTFWVTAFFALGVIIGLPITLLMVEGGKTVPSAIFMGAMCGGYGAYGVFFAGLRTKKRLRDKRVARG
jgi:hypothetical protein